jgi:hypothetical protein
MVVQHFKNNRRVMTGRFLETVSGQGNPMCTALLRASAFRALVLAFLLPSLPYCNALNLGVDFFSSFLSPNSGVTLSFSLFFSLSLDLFQSCSGFWL